MTAPVQVQILVVPDCPHAAPAAVMVTRLLGELNPSATNVRTTVVTDAQQAAALGFAGSPTVLVNGVDPFAGSTDQVGLGCRLYRTPAGLSGLPDADLLRAALSAAMTDERAQ